jgi:hypothetical protein
MKPFRLIAQRTVAGAQGIALRNRNPRAAHLPLEERGSTALSELRLMSSLPGVSSSDL